MDKIGDISVFGVAESKYYVGFSKFKMANPIWWKWIIKNVGNFIKLVMHRFLEPLNPIPMLDFHNSKWRIQYGGPKLSKRLDFGNTGDT